MRPPGDDVSVPEATRFPGCNEGDAVRFQFRKRFWLRQQPVPHLMVCNARYRLTSEVLCVLDAGFRGQAEITICNEHRTDAI